MDERARRNEIEAEAREILAAMEDAKARGEGAAVYKGRLVDIASIKQAEVIVKQSEMIAGKSRQRVRPLAFTAKSP